MNTIYSYKYLWVIEFLIFISLCNDIYAEIKNSRRKNDIIFQRTCENFGFSRKQIGLHNKCIEMVSSLTQQLPKSGLQPSDMEKVANNVKSWNINLEDARELLNILIKYKWGVTEYGLFLQHLDKNPDRMNCVKNVMEAMPWEQWKLFCNVSIAKRFKTYERMPFILTPKEDLEELTHYMEMINRLIDAKLCTKEYQSNRKNYGREVPQFGCPYDYLSAVIDLKNKKAGLRNHRKVLLQTRNVDVIMYYECKSSVVLYSHRLTVTEMFLLFSCLASDD
ncbi:uncharacterized protein LOC142334137 [Lycorma delicatula]|uniref:uncharacterized protein LOC142334137 n=1 Tax=Lycorma delicatula TaxID=130591 RepID=UPI003F510E58